MKLRHLALAALSLTAAFAAPDESNLVLLDTENPAIRDLAVTAGDASTYDSLNEKNKVGVFFSEGLVRESFGSNESGFNLLKPSDGRSSWSKDDFIQNPDSLMFATNGYVEALDLPANRRNLSEYQGLPAKLSDLTTDFPWRIQGNSLRWNDSAADPFMQFTWRINAPFLQV